MMIDKSLVSKDNRKQRKGRRLGAPALCPHPLTAKCSKLKGLVAHQKAQEQVYFDFRGKGVSQKDAAIKAGFSMSTAGRLEKARRESPDFAEMLMHRAEAKLTGPIPYDKLKEMDEINSEFKNADVALVIGANDVVNPCARYDKASPIYGMPILDADKAANIIIVKRSLKPGFAGIDNEIYYNPKTYMFFGDAKGAIQKLVEAVKAGD